MDLMDEVLHISGCLIDYYRKKLSIQVDEFLYDEGYYYREHCLSCKQCKDPKKICSRNTYYKLAKGEIIKNECVYYRFAEKLGKKIILDQKDMYKKLKKYRQLLVENLIDYSRINLEKLEASISYDLTNYQNTLYIYEILSLFIDIIKDRLYYSIPKHSNFDIYFYLKNKIKTDDNKFILVLIFENVFRVQNFDITYESAIENCENYFDDPLFYRVKLASITNTNFLDAYNGLMTREFSKVHTLTKYQRYWLYNSLAHVQLNAEAFESCYSSYEKCLEIIINYDFGIIMEKGAYLQLGRVCYPLKRYDKVIDYFMRAFHIDNKLGKDYPILFSALEKMNKKEQIIQMINNVDYSKLNTTYPKKVLTYYKMKYTYDLNNTKDVVVLENYIYNTLRPFFEIYGTLHRDIFENDLKEYVSITRNYKKYYLFHN